MRASLERSAITGWLELVISHDKQAYRLATFQTYADAHMPYSLLQDWKDVAWILMTRYVKASSDDERLIARERLEKFLIKTLALPGMSTFRPHLES